jgi:putative sugar O-methyltransferase
MVDISQQWQRLVEREFVRIDDEFLETFRAPGSRNKFVAWDPFERSSRYFKFLLLTIARKQSPRFFEAYRALRHRDLGNPLTVTVAGCDVDADYLAAVEEWEFLHDSAGLDGVKSIVEIGAGFGRTAHTLLTVCPQIEAYTIIDLEPMLQLSRAYLKRVAPDADVRFIASDDHRAFESLAPDLVINIDSFQEMPEPVITFYMTHVVQRAPRFYCKNPVGKYEPRVVELPDADPERLLDVLRLGYCQDVIDIFDEEAVERARARFVSAYCPKASDSQGAYQLAASKVMELFPYFLHVLYTRQ